MLHENSSTGTAVVIGAGTMGGGIAAQLANAGWQVKLLDVASADLSPPAGRNGAAAAGLERLRSSRPPLLFLPEFAERIQIGNTSDNLDWLAGADWVVEAVAERMDVKQALLAKIEAHCAPHTVVSSNTSGLSLREMAGGRSADFRSRFLGSHFLNPPRYLKLLEVVPLYETAPEIASGFVRFAEQILGHRVVIAKDMPGFISTRIWIQHLVETMRTALELGLSIEEADALTGALLGRPRSATFRMADIVGLDIIAAIATNQFQALPDDPFRESLKLPEPVLCLIAAGRLGDKSGAGFYKREGKAILALDLATDSYRPLEDQRIPEIDALIKLPMARRLAAIAAVHDTKWGRFVNTLLDSLNAYVEYAGPRIASDTLSVDNVMRWGFQWELGPFEMEDLRTGWHRSYRGIAPDRTVRVFAIKSPRPNVNHASTEALPSDAGAGNGAAPDFVAIPIEPAYTTLAEHKAAGKTLFETADGALVDLGDGVVCLEFRTKMSTFSPGVCQVTDRAREIAERDYAAMVIGGDGPHFSAGYNLKMLLDAVIAEDWTVIDAMLRQVQDTFLALKYSRIPTVAAVRGYTLGAGCECALHCTAIQAGPELAMGLPEMSVGLVPGGGGVKELLVRAMADWNGTDAALPRLEKAFRQIAVNGVSSSAEEARKFGLLGQTDRISRNPDRLLFDAKQRALALALAGYQPPAQRDIHVLGPQGIQSLTAVIDELSRSGKYTVYDSRIAQVIAAILGGGTTQEADVPEMAICAEERAGLIGLAHNPQSIERMKTLLETGKPLKN